MPVQNPTARHDKAQVRGVVGATHWPLLHVYVAFDCGAGTNELLRHAIVQVAPSAKGALAEAEPQRPRMVFEPGTSAGGARHGDGTQQLLVASVQLYPATHVRTELGSRPAEHVWLAAANCVEHGAGTFGSQQLVMPGTIVRIAVERHIPSHSFTGIHCR